MSVQIWCSISHCCEHTEHTIQTQTHTEFSDSMSVSNTRNSFNLTHVSPYTHEGGTDIRCSRCIQHVYNTFRLLLNSNVWFLYWINYRLYVNHQVYFQWNRKLKREIHAQMTDSLIMTTIYKYSLFFHRAVLIRRSITLVESNSFKKQKHKLKYTNEVIKINTKKSAD